MSEGTGVDDARRVVGGGAGAVCAAMVEAEGVAGGVEVGDAGGDEGNGGGVGFHVVVVCVCVCVCVCSSGVWVMMVKDVEVAAGGVEQYET